MPYKSPGAYARFIKTASNNVGTVGSQRTLALIGTGTMFYDAVNEGISRASNRTADELANGNVFEIHSVTSKPLYQGVMVAGSVEYKQGIDFTIKDGKYIAWTMKTDPGTEPKAVKTAGTTTGSTAFEPNVTVVVDGTKDYLVETGKYKVEITYVDPAVGAYRVIDDNTQEILGEFGISATPVDGVIPGIRLTVAETFVPKLDGNGNPVLDPDGNPVSATEVGDYVIIDTTAGQTGGTGVNVPAAGESYYVTYTYRKPETEFVPKVFYDYADVVAEYGDYDVTASGKVINSLALGAEIAFLNGASPIVCVQAKNDGDFEIMAALEKLSRPVAGINNVNTVIPLTTSKTVGAAVAKHVTDMSLPTFGKERMAYLSAADGESIDISISTAKSYGNERVVYVVPGSATKDVKDLRTGKINVRKIPGCYLATGVAALGLKNDPAEPLTNKAITGFKELTTLYTESEMNNLAENGCLVLKPSGALIKVRHGITTYTADINGSEITLVQIKDYVIDSARRILGELYIGNKLRPTIISDIQASLNSILNQFKGQEVIIGFSGVSVKRSSLDPRQVDIRFEIEAVYPLNYIDITFSFSGVS